MRREPIVLVLASDNAYAILMAVALRSALRHLEVGRSVHVYVIDGGISERNRKRLERVVGAARPGVHFTWVVADLGSLRDLESGDYGIGAYLRLLIPDVVAERYHKAIYLDCDVLVEASLSDLWIQPMSEHAVLAVQDFVSPVVSSPGAVANYGDFGYDPDTPYFNSGVMVLNLRRWRSAEISQQIIEVARNHERYLRYADQYGLNAVLAEDWGMLDPKWNVMTVVPTAREDIQSVRDDLYDHGYIHHFTGFKPWQDSCTHPARHRWRRYLEESHWHDPGELTEPIVVTKLDFALQDILAVIPPGTEFIVIDESISTPDSFPQRRSHSLVERDGENWGNPPDDEAAITNLEQMRQLGSRFIVFLWPAFWWFEFYPEFHRYLRSSFTCVLDNDRVVAFDLAA